METVETVSEGIHRLSVGGSEKTFKNPEVHWVKHCAYCDGAHYRSTCSLGWSVPKYAYVNPRYIITCEDCGTKMKNDLQCSCCKRQMPGRILPKTCSSCGDYCVDHTPESCPNKNNPIHASQGDYSSIPPDYAPSSP